MHNKCEIVYPMKSCLLTPITTQYIMYKIYYQVFIPLARRAQLGLALSVNFPEDQLFSNIPILLVTSLANLAYNI